MRSVSAWAMFLTAVCWTTVGMAASSTSQPVYTNQKNFRIPYRYDAEEIRRLRAQEIRLYLSDDRGNRWRHIDSVSPDTRQFDFRASSDGEYWFAVRTVDANGRLHPRGRPFQAGLKVIVDTQSPTLDVRLRQIAPGEVELRWSASDSHLDPSTLKLEYIQPSESDWQQVGIIPKPEGKTRWSVPDGGTVAVRGRISDRADNVGKDEHRLNIEAGRGGGGSSGSREPIAGGSGPQISVGPGFGESGQSAQGRPPQGGQTDSQPPYSTSPDGAGRPFNGSSAGPGGVRQQTVSDSKSSTAPNVSGPGISKPATSGSSERQRFQGTSPWARSGAGQPSGRYRVVDSREFRINYELEDVGPSGISKVELFITQNGGKKWWKYGDDPDGESPFIVNVPGDGVYGFALRVHSGAGLADDPPLSGEEPRIVVVVDQSAPQAELLPIQQGQGKNHNELTIRWRVSDTNPAERPIALYYGSSPEGPWQPISGWQPNNGEFVWTVGPDVPTELYIRLAARDSAGNIAHVRSQKPVVVDLSKPSARIVDVEPGEKR